jgi:hypothetical protein
MEQGKRRMVRERGKQERKEVLLGSLGVVLVVLLGVSGCAESPKSGGPRSLYYTRGIGVYPGLPSEDGSPELVSDERYRNIAKHRKVYHSSSYDYNLTGHLATDGIITEEEPATLYVGTQAGALSKDERECLFDGKKDSKCQMEARDSISLYVNMRGYRAEIDRTVLKGEVGYEQGEVHGYVIKCYGGEAGEWELLGEVRGEGKKELDELVRFEKAVNYGSYRLDIESEGAVYWSLSQWEFYWGEMEVDIRPTHLFTSAWMSAGVGEEWLLVDLGTEARFDKVNIHWINKAVEGKILVSTDGRKWKEVGLLPGGPERIDALNFGSDQVGRYVQLRMTKSGDGGSYVMSEVEVWGRGGLKARPKGEELVKGNEWNLRGGDWKVSRGSEVSGEGESISKVGYDVGEWLVATVPGTVLTSYVKAGAVGEVSESFFNGDFWYRKEFRFPEEFKRERVFLNFKGISCQAAVYVNGWEVGRIESAFKRGEFDVTEVLQEGLNVVAVRIIKHSSIGFGIWDEVYLRTTGKVSIESPFIRSKLPLPDTTRADLFIEVCLRNHTEKSVWGTLRGRFGESLFEQEVSLQGEEEKRVLLNPQTHPVLRVEQPRLWWPQGYGSANLYEVELSFEEDGEESDIKRFHTGIREMDYREAGGKQRLYINGRRFIGRGGKWGLSESNMNYRSREYDIAVGHHAHMHFTMLRNCVCQTSEALYEACDRHGIMVWQDFGLSNPCAEDFVKRIRNHPSIAIYTGGNAGGVVSEGGSAESSGTISAMIEKAFGAPANAEQSTQWSQWIHYAGYRAMFEGRSEDREGLLLCLSHPSCPSEEGTPYDYYFEATAAYFGCRKANEPLHIQWNPIWDGVEVVNYHGGNREGLVATAELINMDGSVRWSKDTLIGCSEDTTVKCFKLELPRTLSTVYFIRLTLKEPGGALVSDNFYWRGKEEGNYQALHQLPKTSLTVKTESDELGGEWTLTTTLVNKSSTPALMVQVQVLGNVTRERMLPVYFSDNFFSLMPGEGKTVTMHLQDVDTRGEQPEVRVSGFNL